MSKRIGRGWLVLAALLLLCNLGLANFASASAADVTSSAAANTTLQDLLLRVSSDRMVGQIENLSKFSRCVTDSTHTQAADYIQSQIKALGFTPVVQSFQSAAVRTNNPLQNIILRKPGSNPLAVHLITAHWDSSPVRSFPPVCNGLAPGANDNGSGTAALLEIARLLSQDYATFQDDIELVWFDGEEFGYLGSQYFVSQWQSDRSVNPGNLPLDTVLNLDMVGVSAGKAKGEVWAVNNGGNTLTLAKEGALLAADYLPEVNYGIYNIGDKFPAARDPNLQSDHRSFWNAGLGTAIFITEDVADIIGGDPRWHTPGDVLYLPDGSLRLDKSLLADSARTALLIASTRARIAPGRYFKNIDLPFEQNWSRADRPVQLSTEGGPPTGRGWLWGPQPNLAQSEAYEQAPGGTRPVVYFDKARMELTDPSTKNVTNGLLVTEMTTGRLQLGDNRFQSIGPSNVPVAGDPNESGQNDATPTYATFKTLVEAGTAPDLTGMVVSATLTKSGQVASNADLASYAHNRYYVRDTGHNIPDVFWDWFGSTGRVYDPQSDVYQTGPVMDWLSTVGLPLTEAYWVRAKVGGVEKDVLVQLFQRRVLTYTPANDPEWRVEMGNVGQHYVAWRYGH
jgi:hypothetical protein